MCARVCMPVCVHARVCACARVCMRASACACVCKRVCVQACLCMCVCSCVCVFSKHCLREGLLICLCETERVHLTSSHRWLMFVKLLQRIFVYEGEKEKREKKKKNFFSLCFAGNELELVQPVFFLNKNVTARSVVLQWAVFSRLGDSAK